MKKSLLALAVLGAFTSIASAQSSVTLYGRIDQNVTLQDPGKNAAATTNGKPGKSVTKLNDGNVNGLGGSRLGFKGTEDLGSGLKAIFQLEAQLFPDEGRAGNSSTLSPGSTTAGNPFFSRFAYLGLSSNSLGEIRLGRQESLNRENNVKINDISGESQFNIVENLEGATTSRAATRPLFQNFGSRVDNGIRYTTPEFAGIRVSAIVGLGERLRTDLPAGAPTVTTKAATYRGLAAVYAAGPLALDLIYEDLRGGAVGNGEYNNVITAGGSYDFGVAKIATAYQHTNNLGGQFAVSSGAGVFTKGTDVDAWNIGVAVPFNAFTFKAQYTGSNISRPAGASDLDQAKYGVSLAYSLSKRTTVYATATERSGDDRSYFVRQSEVAMGLAHTF